MQTDKQKLINYLKTLGVTHKKITSAVYAQMKYDAYKDQRPWEDRLRFAPFTSGLGLIWNNKTIVSVPETPWPGILHEAGHLLAQKYPLDDRRNEVEDEFLGWEWAIVLKLGLDQQEFLRNNQDYGISWDNTENDGEFYSSMKDVPTDLISVYFAERLAWAKNVNIVSADGEPLVVERE